MTTTFKNARWMVDSDGAWLMLNIPISDAQATVNGMIDGKVYEVSINEHRKKRSLDANAYCWLLIGKIAAKVGMPKEAVYREMIRDVGDNYEVIPIRNDAVEKWIENWQSKGIGWVCDILGESKIDGYTNVITYYGSSTYDSLQMSQLINLIVNECHDLGIETMTPAELSLLMDGWKNE